MVESVCKYFVHYLLFWFIMFASFTLLALFLAGLHSFVFLLVSNTKYATFSLTTKQNQQNIKKKKKKKETTNPNDNIPI